jgi:hypothetical protein
MVAGAPLMVFVSISLSVAGIVSLIATNALFTTTVAVARVQFHGFAPACFTDLICDGMFHLVFGATASFHSNIYTSMGQAICYWCHISIGCGSLHSINRIISLH